MSNIKTRKGLAFGALVALGASLIAGAPAHAAGELNVVPSAGSLLSTLSDQNFILNTNFTGANATPTTTADLRYQVKTASAIQLGQGFNTTDAQDDLTNVTTTNGAVDVASATAASANNFLAVRLQSAAANGTVEVTAYVDSNNSNSFTAGEWNTVQTITFKKIADVTSAVVLTTPHAGDGKVSGNVTLDGINLSMIQDPITVGVSVYDSVNRTYGSESFSANILPTGKFSVNFNVDPAGTNIAARAYLGESETAFATTIKKTVAHTVGDLTSTAVAGPNSTGGQNTDVRANSPFVVTAKAWDKAHGADGAAAVAGATVTASFTATRSLDATHTITINGKTYATDADLNAAAVALTTGADGVVTLNVTTVGFAAGNGLGFHFESETIYTSDVSADVVAPVYTVVDAADKLDNDARSAVAGSTTKVTYTVLDQWGQAPANGKFAVQVEGDSITTAHADVANGSATVDVVAAATPAVYNTEVEVTLYEYTTNEHSFTSAVTANAYNEDGFTLYVAPTAEITATTVALTKNTADGSYNLDSSDKFASVDGRFSGFYGYAATPAHNGTAVSFTAVVKAGDVATHTVAGAPVTISAPGLLIVSGNQYGVGTLTVLAAWDGSVSFTVESHKSGTADVTVTSGAATATKTASKWVALAATSIASTVAAASYTTGRVVLVEFTATDKYGNAASAADGSVKAKVEGAGYLVGADSSIGSTVKVAMSAGKGSVQLVNGADQIGTAVVTATYTYTVVTADDTVKTAATTLTFGQTDANLNISGKRVTADWVFAAGKTVTITRDGVTIRTFKPTANSADSFSFNLKKSSKAHRVTIKINGVTVTDAGYLVKK
jgi:hypothetical protein